MGTSPARPHRVAGAHPTADPATQRRRRLRLATALARLRLRLTLEPGTAGRRRERVQICGAANILTALGVRVAVVGPPVPWPRHRPCRLVLTDDVGWLGGLALVTGLPRGTAGRQRVCERVLRGAAGTPAPEDADAVACPVALRYRTAAGMLDRPPRTVGEIVAISGLVVEVHLLPALDLVAGPGAIPLPRAA